MLKQGDTGKGKKSMHQKTKSHNVKVVFLTTIKLTIEQEEHKA